MTTVISFRVQELQPLKEPWTSPMNLMFTSMTTVQPPAPPYNRFLIPPAPCLTTAQILCPTQTPLPIRLMSHNIQQLTPTLTCPPQPITGRHQPPCLINPLPAPNLPQSLRSARVQGFASNQTH